MESPLPPTLENAFHLATDKSGNQYVSDSTFIIYSYFSDHLLPTQTTLKITKSLVTQTFTFPKSDFSENIDR